MGVGILMMAMSLASVDGFQPGWKAYSVITTVTCDDSLADLS